MFKSTIYSFCFLGLMLGGGHVYASSSGVINFTGEIIAGGCDVVSGGESLSVDLGRMSVDSFGGAAGVTAGAAAFRIELINCHAELTGVAVVFDGTPHAEDSSILALQGVDSATGVGVAIYEADGSTLVPLHSPSLKKGMDGESEVTLQYVAKYRSTSAEVVGGEANAVANFTVVYN